MLLFPRDLPPAVYTYVCVYMHLSKNPGAKTSAVHIAKSDRVKSNLQMRGRRPDCISARWDDIVMLDLVCEQLVIDN